MPEDVRIRLVNVELLRPGPSHNQLLSPITPYLAVCNDAGAGIVTVPYEHGKFERLLKDLRYETGDAEDRIGMLHELGVDMGKFLGGVPGLSGALSIDQNQPGTLVHLRLTISASELASLPFELAKTPVTTSATGESWLSIQTRPPVCLTRNIRTVSPEGVVWPEQPRILFVAGDPEELPFDEHCEVLKNAIKPFQYPGTDDQGELSKEGRREQLGEILTILKDAELAEVVEECHKYRYTHIHVLTHGDLDETSPGLYGLVFRGPKGTDVVSGDRFRAAITSVYHRPSVVTVASCDSGNIGSVIIPGASFAHELHQAGIPLVVASQFPLSKEGSVPLTRRLYSGLLWGENPLVLLQEVRAELHARYTASWHDWASLVVYEALPRTLADQLDGLRYFQAKRAMNAALERIDRAVKAAEKSGDFKKLDEDVRYALDRLPLNGQYAVECTGLRASARKRVAQAAFILEKHQESWDPFDLLDQARLDYDKAIRGMLVNDSRALQRLATLHWVLVQWASLSMVLGKEREERDEGVWEAAKLSAERYRDHDDPEQRAWAHGSLSELWLIRLGDPDLQQETEENEKKRRDLSERAVLHARELVRIYPRREEFPVKSTRRQFERYVTWWGHERFEKELENHDAKRLASWTVKYGVAETARRLVELLERKTPNGEREPKGGGSSPAPGDGGPSPAPDGSPSGAGQAAAPSGQPRSLSRPKTAPRERRRRGAPFFDIEALPAEHGDSLWIEYGDARTTHRWLIDCGTQQTARHLQQRVDDLQPSEQFLELFVMSHIDSDHIGGALPFLNAVRKGLRFGDLWFNGWRHVSGRLGARQGEMFSTAIQDLELPWNLWCEGRTIVVDKDKALPVYTLPGGMMLTLLSPTPEKLEKLAPVWSREMKRYGLQPGARVDYSKFLKGTPSTSTDVDELAGERFVSDNGAPNGSSIAVLAEFNGASALLAADAHAPVLIESIKKILELRKTERLKLDVFKVSHHASQNNISSELIQLLDCPRYLVSTNGNHFCHPDRQAIARLIKHGRYGDRQPTLYFNYRSRYNDVWASPELQEKYGYSTVYPPDDQPGLTVQILAEEG